MMSNPWGNAVNLGVARTIVVRVLAHARSADFPPMTVAVLDAAGSVSLADGNLVPVPGGVGVSGHLPDDDEACAIHGITACELRADPGAADPT